MPRPRWSHTCPAHARSVSVPEDPGPCGFQFLDPRSAPPGEDVVALGADLAPSTLIHAYARGLFPMNLPGGQLAWWSPDPRGILPLERLRVTASLRASARRMTVTFDQDFDAVMAGCADPRRPSGWITGDFRRAYGRLHRMGWAHSVEVWRESRLVGGLYGVQVGGLFAGESMFHLERDASKVALVALVDRLRACPGRRLLDVQWCTDHLGSLGAVEVSRSTYLDLLAAAIRLPGCLSG